MFGLGLGVGFSGFGGFTPLAVPNLLAWYRADRGISIGTGVSAWADQSGTGDPNKNLTQATGSKQPTFNSSNGAYGGKPTLSFASASAQYLRSGTWATPIPNPCTQFVVGNFDGSTAIQVLVDGIDATNRLVLFNGSGSGTVISFFAGNQINATVASNASPAVLGAVYNGASSALYISAKTAVVSGNAGTNIAAGLVVGIQDGLASFALNGTIAELIVYSGALSTPTIALLLAYLGARYSITIGP